jgi:tRNA (mo5U34)-methyltransferase
MGILSRFKRESRRTPVRPEAGLPSESTTGGPLSSEDSAAANTSSAGEFLLTEDHIRDRPALRQFMQEIADDGGTYHQLNLRPDLTAPGDYDMRRYIDAYHIPADLTGLRVLDVGTASGFFALECARRGGDVVAIDLWDLPPVARIIRYADLPIRYEKKSVYDLDASFGQFDVVICGSLLLHLPDLFGAISALRRVCRGQLSISTACPADSGQNGRRICEFVADKGVDGNYYTYWLASEAALHQMLRVAGFARVAHSGHFRLDSAEGRRHFSTPHVVTTAFGE